MKTTRFCYYRFIKEQGNKNFIKLKTGIVISVLLLVHLVSLCQNPTCLDIRGDTIKLLQHNKSTICILYSEPICSACIALLSQTFNHLEQDSLVNYFIAFPWDNSVYIRRQNIVYSQTNFPKFTPCFISNLDSISYNLYFKKPPSIIIYNQNGKILHFKNETLFYEKGKMIFIKQNVLNILENL